MPRLYRPGSFLRIPLADGSFGYGRVLKLPHDAYYNYRTEAPDSDLDRIASQPILFKISARHMEERGWELIGWSFQDRTIFDTFGNVRKAEPQECVGLERAAVWEEENVEQHLLDTFMGRFNHEVEHLKVRLK